jgi:hypothetical protein
VSSASLVHAETFNLTVNTIQDVTISESTPLDFGENILTDASTTCSMDADVPAEGTLFFDAGGQAAANYGLITGTGCVGSGVTVATPGVYEIAGEAGLTVTLTLATEAQGGGDYTFSPTGGCLVDYDDGAAGDACNAITVGTPIAAQLATTNDAATSVAGSTFFSVGGTLNVGATGLTSDTDYTATFLVNVVY